jgi:hypothetical protein
MWLANTDSWTLDTGTSIWLIGDTTSAYPPNGIDLPITLVSDGAVVMSTVIRASSSEIVIELGGYRRRMTPAPPRPPGRAPKFFGSEWILGKPVLTRRWPSSISKVIQPALLRNVKYDHAVTSILPREDQNAVPFDFDKFDLLLSALDGCCGLIASAVWGP